MNYTFYRIYSKNPEVTECYIGSTKDFKNRYRYHKIRYTNEDDPHYTIKLYTYMRNNGGFDVFEFEIIDTIIFNNTDRLWHERKLIELYGATLNIYMPIVTKDETIQAKKHYNKQYAIINKEKNILRYAEYRKTHKDKIKDSKKQYSQTHRAEINERKRQYRLRKKEEKLSQSLLAPVP